ncbi:MAG TPA: protein kinase [Pyrinomonadaceae bacterium]|nr:protein kinase [Pyrinomonadaceae bacterium]
MTPERWRQVEEIFQSALDLGPQERAIYVAEVCAADTSLRRDVEKLLSQHESAGQLLEDPLYGDTELSALEAFVYEDEDPLIGRRLGAYRIEREVGRGGMGAVYEAVRVDNEFTLRVAIKLVKRGMDTDFVLRRFRKERQILAALDHPHIARLMDGGTTDDGLPYFVMEFIEGQPLYRYCDANQLSIADRLRLFRSLCDAVHYAHQKQVVHRDIKPSNVLVTSEGVPKLLDFGIAKLLNPALAGDITHDPTATAMRLMTPEYASPEQVQGAAATPTTDVYSLGVLLYELLTGHRPYRLRNRAPHEIARVICEEAPAPPSFIITRPEDLLPNSFAGNEATTLKHLFASRGATLESLRRDLTGDLDTIILRALRKEPEWRYQTAEQLRDDLSRYLDGLPVSDLPDYPLVGATVQTQPISTENSLAVLPLKLLDVQHGADSGPDYLGTGLADALITRLSGIRRFAVRPTSSVLRYGAESDPLIAGRELGVAFVLDGRVRRAGDHIRVTVQLLSVRDGTAVWAGQFDENFTDVLSLEDAISAHVAEAIVPHLSGDERIRLAKRGTDDPQAHEAYLRGRFYWNTFTEDGFAKAIVCYHQAIAVDPTYSVAYAGVAEYYNWLGSYSVLPFRECSAAAYEAASTAVAIDPILAEGHAALGQAILTRDFDWRSAERQVLRAIELNPNYAAPRVWYAFHLAMEGRFTESLREAHIARELDPMAILSRFAVAWCSYHARRYDQALALCRDTLAAEPHNFMMLYCSSFVLGHLGHHEEAITNARLLVDVMGKASHTLSTLAVAYARAGDTEAAESVLREMDEIEEQRYISPFHRALVNAALGKPEQALDLLEHANKIRDAKVLWLGVDPELTSLHGHPRYNNLLEKLKHRLAAVPTLPVLSTIGQESIAVLPFQVITAVAEGTGDEYLGVGLADALITRLSNFRRLVVRPTSSVLRYRGTENPIEAGRELNVDYVVDGNLRRSGNRLRVTAQLLSVADGVTRWGEQFDEESNDVLQLEDSISEKVVAALLPQLSGDEQRQLSKRGTDSAEAFESYLRGRYYWNTYTEAGLAKALESYNHAIDLDPNYALAYTGIADYYNWLGVFGIRPFAETSVAAKRAAAKAVELDPSSAEAYSALGFATVTRDFDWAVAEGEHRRAVELNPNYATGHHWYAFHLLMVGRFEDGLREMLRARELDPLSPSILQSLGWAYYQARRFDESVSTHQKVVETFPDFALGSMTYSWLLRHIGRTEEAVNVAEKALDSSSGGQIFIAALGASYAAAGRQDDARAALSRLDEMATTSYVSPYHRALVHANLGERDQAMALLQEAYATHDGWLVWLGVEPDLDSLRDHPDFADLLRKTGNPAPSYQALAARAAASVERQSVRASKESGSGAITAPVVVADTLPSENEEARQLYTAGRYYAARRSTEGLRQAIERFERAVEIDPGFALAYAELADCYSLLNWYVEPAPAGAWKQAKQAALKAVEADPNLAEAHAALGFVRLHYDRDWDDAERELRKAIRLRPSNQVAHRWYAYSLSAMGRHDEALAEIQRAREISPQSPVMATGVANVLFLGSRFDEAISQCRRALDLDPGAVAAHTVLRWAYEKKGMHAEALAAYEQERVFAGDTPTTHAKRAHVLAATGKLDEARSIVEEIVAQRDEQFVTAYEIAIIYSWLGDNDKAFEWLAQAEREHAVGFTFVRVDPHLDPLRSDPRFADLVGSIHRTND